MHRKEKVNFFILLDKDFINEAAEEFGTFYQNIVLTIAHPTIDNICEEMFNNLNVLFANYLENINLHDTTIIKKITRWQQSLEIFAPNVPAEEYSAYCIACGFLKDKEIEINKKLLNTLTQTNLSQNTASMYNNATSAPEEKSSNDPSKMANSQQHHKN